jgi:hypothetical protein
VGARSMSQGSSFGITLYDKVVRSDELVKRIDEIGERTQGQGDQ